MIYRYYENKKTVDTPMNISFKRKYDIVIVGAGTTGSFVALRLAQLGHKVALIDRMYKVGGTITHCVNGYYYGSTGGLFETIDKEIHEFEHQEFMVSNCEEHIFNPLARVYTYEKKLMQLGVDIYLETWLCGTYINENSVCGLQLYNTRSGLVQLGCKFAVDSTGDGFLCEMLGAKMQQSTGYNNNFQPFSSTVTTYLKSNETIRTTNVDSGYINQYDAADYSKKIIDAAKGKQLLKDKYTSDEIVLFTPLMLGLREGKTIKGIKQIRFEDLIYDRQSKEPLFFAYSHFDNHGKSLAFESQNQNDWVTVMSLWAISMSVKVCKENLLIENINNVIVAGRSFARDHDVYSHLRMNRDLLKLGESVSVIINEALTQCRELTEIKYNDIIDALTMDGCFNLENDVGVIEVLRHDNRQILTKMPDNIQEIEIGLLSEKPGLAMLAALRLSLKTELKQWIQSPNENLRFNAASVLALMNDKSGVNILAEHARIHDSYRPKTGRKYNTPRGISAIYLIGRLNQKQYISLLVKLLENLEVLRSDQVSYDDLIMNLEDYHFHYLTHIIRALLSMRDVSKTEKKLIETAIDESMQKCRGQLLLSLKYSGESKTNTINMYSRLEDYLKESKVTS